MPHIANYPRHTTPQFVDYQCPAKGKAHGMGQACNASGECEVNFMKNNMYKSLILAAALAGLFVVGCNVHVTPPAAEVEVSSAPPPPPAVVDVETPMPGPDFVWIGGVWVWGPGGRWVWEKGHWDHPPHPGAVWVAHSYAYRNGRHVFVRGGWR